ncbi:hypothetical protein J3Q64DRAFT_1118019 [Phycomyces blakesleeanus]|uniref:Selenoprotein O n=2 Tax=Phycomyces blakesleeanus TaxID=4837 RepID=A0A163E7M1_PHYB8|nr:hypothetical protein PHYBLDRAFT_180347 [Phycomyces blakesleeanus NRRL 1555(-)]OAD77160.1 hypothetical protein PHYBLDRAFT_180347 [Phycomyces blakesleeanus NRRL 1555(-)]|eukprot:XP_018295200.1 hypothetical protein PHYBLDRAFT_180347 [Phycomyces blakesleeanus NRRL 1555(-)]
MYLRAFTARSLESLPIRPSVFTRSLPADSHTSSTTEGSHSESLLRVSRPVHNAVFAYVPPETSPNPKVLAVSSYAVQDLELDPEESKTEAFAHVFAGNKILEGTRPWALCYAGHQFGQFAGQLGDGRAISLFETVSSKGDKFELQLKGAGRTPFSRFGDGLAVLRSSIREFLVSEHMYALGVPTTRSLALTATGKRVYRQDAPPEAKQPERGATVARMAPSWLRFGNFEIFFSRGDMENVRNLADYAIENVLPEEKGTEEGNKYERFFTRVTKRTAKMVAEWQSIGFCHGVMNTDNMSILGLTLDYGPFQILDFYDPENICNHSDHTGMYSFKRQPTVCVLNLFKLSIPLFELIGAGDAADSIVYPIKGRDDLELTSKETLDAYREAGREKVTKILTNDFSDWFMADLTEKMRSKLGFTNSNKDDMDDIVIPLLDWLTEYAVDYHSFFRSLADYPITDAGEDQDTKKALETLSIVTQDPGVLEDSKSQLKTWLSIYRHRLLEEGPEKYGDKRKRMNRVNPRFVLRNWIAQDVVNAFEDLSDEEARGVLDSCLKACVDPFEDNYEDQRIEKWINTGVPEWGVDLKCSCSS